MKITSTHYIIFFVVIITAGLVSARVWGESKPSILDEFAQCISDSGAKFYGAFWCPHCNDQKKLFGSSVKNLPYIECSTPDGNSQLQECRDAEIQSYPTWEFADGTRQGGVISLQELSEITNCQLPE